MNWKLVLQLSMFGLGMGIATVFIIPSSIEPAFWLVIFVVCAYLIAKRVASKHFLHGLLLGLANSVWITLAHVLLADRYLATHIREASMMATSPSGFSPRTMMAVVGPLVGLVSGVVIGVLAVLAGKIMSRNAGPGASGHNAKA